MRFAMVAKLGSNDGGGGVRMCDLRSNGSLGLVERNLTEGCDAGFRDPAYTGVAGARDSKTASYRAPSQQAPFPLPARRDRGGQAKRKRRERGGGEETVGRVSSCLATRGSRKRDACNFEGRVV